MLNLVSEFYTKYNIRTSWPILVGIMFLYLPFYYKFFGEILISNGQGYAPIIFLMVIFLFWQKRDAFFYNQEDVSTHPIFGSIIFILGLALYVVGYSQDLDSLSIGSQLPVIAGILIITHGFSILTTFWFPLLFTVFMVPIPGSIMDVITLPMKTAVSYVAQFILFELDYPISRTGVTLQIAQYKLLVADACAGMHTLVSLEAMGLFYLNLNRHESFFRNTVLAMLIVPISFVANVTRVLILILVTYYFGDEAGQGFIHKFAGMVLFVVGLVLIMGADFMLQNIVNFLQIRKIKLRVKKHV